MLAATTTHITAIDDHATLESQETTRPSVWNNIMQFAGTIYKDTIALPKVLHACFNSIATKNHVAIELLKTDLDEEHVIKSIDFETLSPQTRNMIKNHIPPSPKGVDDKYRNLREQLGEDATALQSQDAKQLQAWPRRTPVTTSRS